MNKELTLSDGRGSRFPNPRALGFKWSEEQKLGEELDKLKRLQRDAGHEQQVQRDHIRQLENEHAKGRALAFRGAEAPDERPLAEAREKLAELQQKDQDLRRAVEMVRADYFKTIQKNREQRSADVSQKAARARAHAEEIAAELRRAEYEVVVLDRLNEFLDNPEIGFGLAPPPPAGSTSCEAS